MALVGIRERKKAETRARIIECAVELFRERGVEDVSVEEIAARAEVGKGTVYNYFDAKEDLLVAFVTELDRWALRDMAALAAAGSAAEVLDAAAWRLLSAKAAYREFVRVFMARMLTSETFLDGLGEFQSLLDAALGGLFDALRARGLVRVDLETPELILSFKTLQLGLTCLWAVEGPPHEQARRMTRTLTRAFALEIAP
jgi:AcrR family transcriptional regulator